jgi:hypothetical protein
VGPCGCLTSAARVRLRRLTSQPATADSKISALVTTKIHSRTSNEYTVKPSDAAI